jgi:tetratricopeptide (TPR) repeat protein
VAAFCRWYALALIGYAAWLLASRPIVALDTDLWFHLNAGRYLAQHGAVPREAFFSFLSPPRPWVVYSWLFDAAAYGTYTLGRYYGLIALRVALYLAMMGCVAWFLLRRADQGRGRAWAFALLACYALALLPRSLHVRPHAVTYALIPLVCGLLERRSRWRWLALAAPGLLWSNAHGALFPVVLVIGGAYLTEYLVRRAPWNASRWPADRGLVAGILALIGAILVTPYGLQLPATVLRVVTSGSELSYVESVIRELRPGSEWDWAQRVLSVSVSALSLPTGTMLNLILIASFVAVAAGLRRRTLRIAHLLLWAGGLAISLRGIRFAYEFALLSLPMLAAHPPAALGREGALARRPIPVLLALFLLIAPVRAVTAELGIRGRYPLSLENMPQGIVMFLKQAAAGGNVLHTPNPGGFYQWALYPDYRIFMAMQTPMPFTRDDLYVGLNAFVDGDVLRAMIQQYDPAFLSVPLSIQDFPDLVKAFPEYVLVFFDDLEALYVDRAQHPTLAQAHALEAVNPFEFGRKSSDTILEEQGHLRIGRELDRVLKAYPAGRIASYLAAAIAKREETFDRVIPRAQAMVEYHPDYAQGYAFLGEAQRRLQRPQEAIRTYRQGLKACARAVRAPLYEGLGSAFLQQGRYRQAYLAFQRGVAVYDRNTEPETLYDYGVAALRIGRAAQAREIFEHLLAFRAGEERTRWTERINAVMREAGHGR